MTRWVDVCAASDLPADRPVTVRVNHRDLALVRCADGGAPHAVDNRCPHPGGQLGDGSVRGDDIVCRATAPTWSPLLAVAAGLVANSGSVLGHTAIVARELGIPAVVAAKDATTRIHDGDLLRVDGTTGEVRILERAGPRS